MVRLVGPARNFSSPWYGVTLATMKLRTSMVIRQRPGAKSRQQRASLMLLGCPTVPSMAISLGKGPNFRVSFGDDRPLPQGKAIDLDQQTSIATGEVRPRGRRGVTDC